jgi:hypothetical protein
VNIRFRKAHVLVVFILVGAGAVARSVAANAPCDQYSLSNDGTTVSDNFRHSDTFSGSRIPSWSPAARETQGIADRGPPAGRVPWEGRSDPPHCGDEILLPMAVAIRVGRGSPATS